VAAAAGRLLGKRAAKRLQHLSGWVTQRSRFLNPKT
jgi:hypothetical protein